MSVKGWSWCADGPLFPDVGAAIIPTIPIEPPQRGKVGQMCATTRKAEEPAEP